MHLLYHFNLTVITTCTLYSTSTSNFHVVQVKDRLYSHTGILPPEQEVSGWPFSVTDEVTMYTVYV